MKCIATNILTPLAADKIIYLPDHYITINEGKIIEISDTEPAMDWIDKRDYLCIPGMIDAHVHLSQYYIRGRYAPDLMQWLHKYTFPAEQMSNNPQFSRKIAIDFYQQCLAKGTTTSVVYTSPYHIACETAFEVAKEMGVRSIIGMTMMDTNCPDYLRQDTDKAINESYELWEKWHDQGLLDYIFSPRFAVTCSAELLQETGRMIRNLSARMQTHLSENTFEIEQVMDLFPGNRSYTEIYEHFGLLGKRSIMGHGIHLDQEEMRILQASDTGIAFCPDSNFFLKSGHFKWSEIEESGIRIGLASDVGAGTDLSMLKIMKLADYILDKSSLTPGKAFYYSTLGNAVLLGWEDRIGSIEPGKDADLVFISHPEILKTSKGLEDILALLIYLNYEMEIQSTWIQGKELYNKDKSGGIDEIS
ncbi:MAG: guanine deaminase [Candidatus Stygibacter australis]|nr:guanine deaminase [Candidatus Stygibacter australis]MDP8321292.1 guanine deaminase [Candidatus Stygibacter australis]